MTHKLYEDTETIAFLDIAPCNPGHTVVATKDHYENIYGTPPEIFARMALTAQKISTALKNAVDAEGVNILMNNEPAAGQMVFHTHLHVIPRKKDDGIKHWPQGEYKEGEAESVAKQIKDNLGE